MAKAFEELDKFCSQIVSDTEAKKFAPVYLLMGDEDYYVDLVCNAVISNAFDDESERDFNQMIYYGADVDADEVVTAARRYPMFAERQLVVVKEAQMMKTLENLAVYCENPLESTVLVIAMHGASADKRKALYKSVSKKGIVVESKELRDYEMPQWIASYYRSRGLEIEPEAAALLAEYAGVDMAKIAVETDKLLKNLPAGSVKVSASDIERNVGISREFSIFELTRELSFRNVPKALKIAAYIGDGAKFALPMATAALFTHFYRILKYHALLKSRPSASTSEKASLLGVNPYFLREYDTAIRNYPPGKAMSAIALLKEYDFKGKGGDNGEASPGELFTELILKLLA
ncbi:MAG: DNA polymerase III subunit delta [Rikenellaceae bacterium]|nr:DNA polymerase III subunit delta [Rikenellaceae bacterium]